MQARQPFPSFYTVKIVFRYPIGSNWQLLYNKRVTNWQNAFFELMKKNISDEIERNTTPILASCSCLGQVRLVRKIKDTPKTY